MPTYEYRCQSCESEFERKQRITDAPIRRCPRCKRHTVERLISGSMFLLKGSGWYRDGYGSPKAAPKTNETKKTAEGSGG